MKYYIDLNTQLSAKTKTDFQEDFLKLINNSVFGKTMENIRRRVNIKLVSKQKSLKNWQPSQILKALKS